MNALDTVIDLARKNSHGLAMGFALRHNAIPRSLANRLRSGGPGKCKCGRTISANKRRCRSCSDVKEQKTA